MLCAEVSAAERSWPSACSGWSVSGPAARAALLAIRAAPDRRGRLAACSSCADWVPSPSGCEHPDRLRIHADRIEPTQAGHLYPSATAALCPYRSDGEFGFFAQVLHPSSVGTARGFATPVIAPALPAVVEMTTGCRRFLYPADHGSVGAADAAARAERTAPGRGRAAGEDRSATRWRRLIRTYQDLARTLAEGHR